MSGTWANTHSHNFRKWILEFEKREQEVILKNANFYS